MELLKFTENEIGRDLISCGHGTQRSIQMTLIQHLSDIKRGTENKSIKYIIID